ncbi:MAG: Mpo1-like protein, partial [Pseudomonadota bacterium]
LAFSGASLASLTVVPYPGWVALALFVITWIFQFIGHEIEGKKPSFFEDLRFLLVGPLFLLAKLFRRQGWRF